MDAYIPRLLTERLKKEAEWFPVVSLTGPRQSGKSTLAQRAFPDYAYVTLEDPQVRAAAVEDPVGFIRSRDRRLVIDEAQYAPQLFSMIQVASDECGDAGQYILTGSQNFLMMKSISQSLAGRVGLLRLLPLSFKELQDASPSALDPDAFAFKGGYPRLHDKGIPPDVYFSSYVDTYVERDVAGLMDVRSKGSFGKLLEICAQNVGSLLNIASLSNDAGVSVPTVNSWLSILSSSYIVFTLQPYHANIRKRLTKTSKLYFYDTGLLCYLLRIGSMEQLVEHPLFGAVFENLVVAETLKGYMNRAVRPELYFYRDDSKREIDLLDFTDPEWKFAVEVKSSRTFHEKYARHLNAVCDELGVGKDGRSVVLRVDSSYDSRGCKVVSARDWLMGV